MIHDPLTHIHLLVWGTIVDIGGCEIRGFCLTPTPKKLSSVAQVNLVEMDIENLGVSIKTSVVTLIYFILFYFIYLFI